MPHNARHYTHQKESEYVKIEIIFKNNIWNKIYKNQLKQQQNGKAKVSSTWGMQILEETNSGHELNSAVVWWTLPHGERRALWHLSLLWCYSLDLSSLTNWESNSPNKSQWAQHTGALPEPIPRELPLLTCSLVPWKIPLARLPFPDPRQSSHGTDTFLTEDMCSRNQPTNQTTKNPGANYLALGLPEEHKRLTKEFRKERWSHAHRGLDVPRAVLHVQEKT